MTKKLICRQLKPDYKIIDDEIKEIIIKQYPQIINKNDCPVVVNLNMLAYLQGAANSSNDNELIDLVNYILGLKEAVFELKEIDDSLYPHQTVGR